MEVALKKLWESVNKKIVPCSSCNGSGIIEVEKLTSYHNNDYSYYNEVCKKCDGDGRLLETKYVVKISVIIPNDKYETIDFSKSYHEKLNGRTIEDIYKISKITVDKN
jgi:DnaJ-class molecular chaperone